MKRVVASVVIGLCISKAAAAQTTSASRFTLDDTPLAPMQVTATGIDSSGYITPEHAFCAPANEGHVTGGADKNIGLSWKPGPEGTKSYAIVAVDPDVPAVFTDAGKEGKTLAADMPRQDFYHWVLYNIPANVTAIPEGADSSGPAPHGKPAVMTSYGMRGVNSYADYFASDPDHKGEYAGYDGPCPPWNDERVHHYHFHVFALDTVSLTVPKHATGPEVLDALASHIAQQGEVIGKYTLNSSIAKP